MSYLEKMECKNEYRIEPEESFTVIHNCAGCGHKERFINTKRFRVNANGNRLDVWLIYQCEKCKHTLNLSIYERVDRKKVPTEEYQLFLKNDEALAEQYGMDNAFFKRNRAEVDWDHVLYSVKAVSTLAAENVIIIHNPHGVRIRPEKLVSIIMNVSRSMVIRMLDHKEIILCQKGLDLEITIC